MKMETESYQPFVVANQMLHEPERLRQTLRDNGYLFFHGLAPKENILETRRDILEICREAGWVTNGQSDLMKGVWSGAGPYTENEPDYMAVYRNILRLPSFSALPEHPFFLELMEKILDAPVVMHKRRIGRVTFPQNAGQTTGAHQDWHYIRGTPETYTIWLPIGDCPQQLGGLAVLKSSQHQGYLEHTEFAGKKYAAAGLAESNLPSGENIEWHSGDFQVGDFLVFHSHTIHKALPNLTPDRLRLSADNRYQRVGTEMEPGSMGSHYNLV